MNESNNTLSAQVNETMVSQNSSIHYLKSNPSIEDALFKHLNTAVVRKIATKSQFQTAGQEQSLISIKQSTATRVILSAIHELAALEGVSEKESSERVVEAFRQLESLWNQAIFQSGVQQILDSKS